MSRINDLIKEKCPNGVIYDLLENISQNIMSGGTPLTSKREYYDGNIPWLRSGEINFNKIYDTELCITELGLNNSSTKIVKGKSVVIAMTGATVARVGTLEKSVSVNQSVCVVELDENKINYRFLYHYLSSEYNNIKGQAQGALTSINMNFIKKISVPILPIEVQDEIVDILDKFCELEAELEEELETRKKQYDFYRENLFSNKYKIIKLKEIADIYLGLTYRPTYVESGVKFISSQNISKDYLDLTNVKYISRDEFNKSTSNAKPQKGDILFVRVGSNLGHPIILNTDEELCIFVSLGYLRVKNNNVLNKYLRYWMTTKNFEEQVSAKTLNAPKANLNTSWLREFEIPLPSLKEQKRIVSILDKFDKLINDISEGLPAEIELRKKQYEYYRNKLLSFEDKL